MLSVRKASTFMLQSHPGWETEVWVVDNNSSDDSLEMLHSHFPEIKLIANQKNTGFSVANNQAISQSSGEYILLLNPDTVVQEDTFLSTVSFMDEHQDAGGLGVKMLDGQGIFLPESKRGFPSPAVAFFKIAGLSKLFPKSKLFGRYHLGYLSKNETHAVDVLAGAFMLLRKKTLEQIGLLDETFFMYGEDIDLSYRIIKAGYKNYYFPHTRIIHYKGESTKKSSVNYVFVFYQAMIIFARKHFSKNKAFLFSILLNFAIYIRAGASIIVRMFGKLLLPFADFLLSYGAMYFFVHYWERTIKYIDGGMYPAILLQFFVPLYILCWMLGLWISGSYRKPFQYRRIFRGVLVGTFILTIVYAFLNESYRFSRAIILLGAILASIIYFINRLMMRYLRERSLSIDEDDAKKIIIIGSKSEAERVVGLLDRTRLHYDLIGFISPNEESKQDDLFIGDLSDIYKLIKIYKVGEIIFCSKDISADHIISLMIEIHKRKAIEFKIVPEHSNFVIGSNSKDKPGDYYSYEIEFKIVKPEMKSAKRLFDVLASLFLILTLPFNIWFIPSKNKFISNIFSVLFGSKTWISYYAEHNKMAKLPMLKNGVISPYFEVIRQEPDDATKMRLDYIYAKDYNLTKDLSIFFNGFSNLGQS